MKILKYCVAIVLFVVLLRIVDVRALVECVQLITFTDVVVLLTLSYLLIAVSVLKWRAFLRYLGVREGFHRLFGLYLVGYFVNLLMPSYIGGDVVRALKVGEGKDKEAAFSATLLERYTGLAAMLVLASFFVAFARGVTPEIRMFTYCCSGLFVLGSIFAFAGIASSLATLFRLPEKFASTLQRIERSMWMGVSNGPLLVRVVVLSVLFHSLTIVNTVAVSYAVGWHSAPWLDLFVVVPLILLVGALPVSPQGLGIQEGAFLYFLHSVGATTSEALAVALVLRVKSYLLAVAGGVIWFLERKRDATVAL